MAIEQILIEINKDKFFPFYVLVDRFVAPVTTGIRLYNFLGLAEDICP